jgi:hypothetical protein
MVGVPHELLRVSRAPLRKWVEEVWLLLSGLYSTQLLLRPSVTNSSWLVQTLQSSSSSLMSSFELQHTAVSYKSCLGCDVDRS